MHTNASKRRKGSKTKTTQDTMEWGGLAYVARLRGLTWDEVSEELGLSTYQCMKVYNTFREMTGAQPVEVKHKGRGGGRPPVVYRRPAYVAVTEDGTVHKM